jgi:catechol 2,3-dioxygenase-like lactoylglutathione lyase family enzyme
MRPQLDLITLGVPDLEAARRFYVDGLGWRPTLVVPGDVVFIQVGHGLMLSLFGAADLAADMGAPLAGSPAPMSLAQIVETEDEVVRTLERAKAAGAEILKTPQKAEFGGFHGYFADPAGFRWEIATNPGWSVAPDGTVTVVPVEG